MSAPLLSLSRIAAARGGRLLFEGVELTLGAGAAAIVTGPNGAGKSTLLRVAAGLLPPSAGRVERANRAGWLGEANALDGDLALARALGFWAAADGIGRDAERVARALAGLGLTALGTVPVRWLSTGQRRRAGFARVVAAEAPLWLLDEPASGLDAAAVAALEAAITAHRAAGGAVMIATHQPLALPDAAVITLGAPR